MRRCFPALPLCAALLIAAPLMAATPAPAERCHRFAPLDTPGFTADPAAHVFDGKLHVYVSHDIEGPPLPDVAPFLGSEGNAFRMRDYRLLVMDRVGGTVETVDDLLSLEQVPWAARQMWAPDVATRAGRYYLYFPAKDHDGQFRIGVAVADSPRGPFKADPMPIAGTFSIDPTAFVDDDGQAYLYFGGRSGGQLERHVAPVLAGSAPGAKDAVYMPQVARLHEDMRHLAEAPRNALIVNTDGSTPTAAQRERQFFEGAWVHKRAGVYHLLYSTGEHRTLAHATAGSPYGPFTFRGTVLLPVTGWTTHASIVPHDGRWWLFHADSQRSGKTWLRTTKVAELHYREDGSIETIDPFVAPDAPDAHGACAVAGR